MKRKNNYLKSFTIAETLITLGIIGVIAALTISVLINKIEKAVYFAQFKEADAIITNALTQVYQDYNFNITGAFTNSSIAINEIASKLKYQKICNSSNYSEVCWHKDQNVARTLTKAYAVSSVSPVYDSILLNNGMFIGVSSGFFNSACNSAWIWNENGDGIYCADLLIDTNGIKGPNILGRDIFSYILSKNKFVPSGMDNQDVALSDGFCTLNDGESSYPQENGKACTYRLLIEHKMNY